MINFDEFDNLINDYINEEYTPQTETDTNLAKQFWRTAKQDNTAYLDIFHKAFDGYFDKNFLVSIFNDDGFLKDRSTYAKIKALTAETKQKDTKDFTAKDWAVLALAKLWGIQFSSGRAYKSKAEQDAKELKVKQEKEAAEKAITDFKDRVLRLATEAFEEVKPLLKHAYEMRDKYAEEYWTALTPEEAEIAKDNYDYKNIQNPERINVDEVITNTEVKFWESEQNSRNRGLYLGSVSSSDINKYVLVPIYYNHQEGIRIISYIYYKDAQQLSDEQLKQQMIDNLVKHINSYTISDDYIKEKIATSKAHINDIINQKKEQEKQKQEDERAKGILSARSLTDVVDKIKKDLVDGKQADQADIEYIVLKMREYAKEASHQFNLYADAHDGSAESASMGALIDGAEQMAPFMGQFNWKVTVDNKSYNYRKGQSKKATEELLYHVIDYSTRPDFKLEIF